ncbi:MAG: hypothetical protein M1833_005037 [Piccolia ochrophora]|nr:MAG: hypothetical protein M1833_005037 [Piccolia ochrophora]
MASRPRTPLPDDYDSVPHPDDPAHLDSGYGTNLSASNPTHRSADSAGEANLATTPANPIESSPLAQPLSHNGQFHEEFDISKRSSAAPDSASKPLSRSNSQTMQAPSRSGTLKKKASLSRKGSLKRSGSRRSSHAGSVKSVIGEKEKYGSGDENESSSVFYTPVPTSGNPTEVLAHRFQAWRKVLKDLVAFFREIQASYEQRSKALLKVSNVINNTAAPGILLPEGEGGVADATHILRDYYKKSIAEHNKAKEIENDVIVQLNGLRADLNQKIKEIKNLSGDFKNSVDKEMGNTRKAVRGLQESLGLVDTDPHATTGKGDPFIVKLGVDKQVEKQLDEENYLHRAFLNLEGSGRELESIVVGEIQKSYNALAGILKREADEAYDTTDQLRSGPIELAKDHEWTSFVQRDSRFVDPRTPLRNVEEIGYPGRDHPAAAEVRAGMLERKSKYLKSYTPGWYVLSSTHLHEFKSAERINVQAPVMSLYLPEQKLGTHSQPGSSSHKFILKGRQTGAMHRGHSWVFRAESHDTMLAWYEDIRNLTEKSGEERNTYVRRHARSMSAGSHKAGSISSEGALEEDEADEVPYSATASVVNQPIPQQDQAKRPQPGGRFPSDFQVDRGLQGPRSSSSASSYRDRDVIAAANALPGAAGAPYEEQEHGRLTEDIPQDPYRGEVDQIHILPTQQVAEIHQEEAAPAIVALSHPAAPGDAPLASHPVQAPPQAGGGSEDLSKDELTTLQTLVIQSAEKQTTRDSDLQLPYQKHDSVYGEWMAPATVAGGNDIVSIGGPAADQQVNSDQKRDDEPTAHVGTGENAPVLAASEEMVETGGPSSGFAREDVPSQRDRDSQIVVENLVKHDLLDRKYAGQPLGHAEGNSSNVAAHIGVMTSNTTQASNVEETDARSEPYSLAAAAPISTTAGSSRGVPTDGRRRPYDRNSSYYHVPGEYPKRKEMVE